MESKTQGAWLIHHTKKLQEVTNAQEFEDIELAGKCGIFLSNLAASDEQSELNAENVAAIARVSEIKKTEIDTIKRQLEKSKLIEISSSGAISVLGVTTSSVLSHTSNIFSSINPSNYQKAAIDLSENISNMPKGEDVLKEYISDTHRLTVVETTDLFNQAEEIGIVDYEKIDGKSKLYFNGNLFRRDALKKTDAVLSSLKPDDNRKIAELDQLLSQKGCVDYEKANSILGNQLLSKLQSIAMYDYNQVSNSKESKILITKPSAFSKYGNPFEEDAFDLAKAFVSSLYYGMHHSSVVRGQITMLRALLRKLINGFEVGPAIAIGEDYKILEMRRVVKIRRSTGNMYYMGLLKKDIGLLALQVLEHGSAAEQIMMDTMSSGSVTGYVGPEKKRQFERKRQNEPAKQAVANLLRTFRS